MNSRTIAPMDGFLNRVGATGWENKFLQLKFPDKKTLITGASVLLILMAIIGGTAGWIYMASHQSTDDAYVDGNLTTVSSRLNGTVFKVLVNDNQYVKAGQALAILDPRDYDVKVEQAKASLEKAQRQAQADTADVSVTATDASAQVVTADSDVLHANASVSVAESDVANARAALGVEHEKIVSLQTQQKQNAIDLQRYVDLVAEGAISKQQYEQSKTQYDVSTAQVAAEMQASRQAQANIVKAEAELEQAYSDQKKTLASKDMAQAAKEQTTVKTLQSQVTKATIDQAAADLQNALLQRSYTTISAPVSGRIGKRSLEQGEQVQVGQALFSLVPDSPWITANFKETQIGGMKPHQPVDVTIDAFPGQHFKGYIDSMAPASGAEFALLPAENATGNFTKIVQRVPIKIDFDTISIAAYKELIVPGLSAQVTVALTAR